jgi:hypothetical protein
MSKLTGLEFSGRSCTLLKDPELVCCLLTEVIPLLVWIKMDLNVLDDMLREDLV